MTMDSWFSDSSGGNGEDTSALWAQEEEDRKKREEAYQAGQLGQPPAPAGPAMFGPGAQAFPNYPPMQAPPIGDLGMPYSPPPPEPVAQYLGQQFAQPEYGPPAPPPMAPPPGINPTQGGFRQTELQPDPNALTDNPLALPFGVFNAAREATYIPYVTPAIESAKPYIADVVNSPVSPLGGLNWASQQLGGPDIGYNVAEQTPSYGLDFALNALGAKSIPEALTGLPLGEMGLTLRTGAQDVGRALMPEPNFAGANLSAGIPPFNPGEIPDLGQGPQMLGGELPAPGGRLYQPDAEPFRGAPPPPAAAYPSIPEGTIGQQFPEVVGQPEFYNGNLTGRTVSENAPAARMGAPLAYDPQFMTPPPADAAMREAGVGPPDLRAQMQTAQDNARALETGGGTPVGPPAESISSAAIGSPPPASPAEGQVVRIAVQPDAIRPLEDFVAPGKGFEITDPSKARILGPGENVEPGEMLMLHGTGSVGIQGDLRAGINVTNDPAIANRSAISESRLEGMGQPSAGAAPTGSTTAATLTSNATPFESAHQGLANVAETPTPPATDIAGLRDEVRQLREAVEANGAPPRWGEPPPTGGGGAGKGGAAASGGTPKGQGLLGTIRDLLYAPFGFDWSSWLRQDVMRTLNPFRIAETVQVAKDSTRSIADRNFALQFEKDFKDRATALGVPNLHFPDWQGGDIIGRENLYSKLLNSLPGYEALNRGFSTDIASRRINALENFVKNHPEVGPGSIQTEANRLERMTGRGSFGASNEKALSTIGAPFTALRNAISIPQRAGGLIPWQGLADPGQRLFGPSWREAVVDHAGFVTSVAAAMAAAQQAGFGVGWDPSNQTSNSGGKVPFGKIELPNGSLIDLTGGTGKYVNAVMQLATGEKNGKDYPWLWEQAQNGQYKGTIAEFVRNLSGPTVQLPLAGLKDAGVKSDLLEFMRPDLWDKPLIGNKNTFANQVAKWVVPLWIQSTAEAVRNSASGNQLPSQVAAGALNFLGAGVNTYERKPLDDLRESVKNNPALPDTVRGEDYKDLGPRGKAEQDKAAEQAKPEEYKQAKEDQKQNSDPVFQAHRDAVEQADKEEAQRKTDVYNALRDGRMSGEQARQAREAINSASNAKKEAANTADFKKAVDGLEKNDVGKALSIYYDISKSTPLAANGKPDYEAAHAKQEEFIRYLIQNDRSTANKLLYEVAPKPSDNPLDRIYQVAQPTLQKYFGDTQSSTQRSDMRRGNPQDDALLNLLGYENKTLTPQAATILQQMRSSLPANTANTASPVAAAASAPVQRSAIPAPAPAPAPQQSVAPLPTPTGAPRTLPPVAPGEFNSAQASPQQRQNFITAMTGPANDFAYTKIPPAVFAAIGASESNYGRAPSIFGIKGVGTAGGADLATHEVLNGQKVNMNDQFAAYNNLDDAFNHFIDLTSHGRYAPAWNELQQTGDWQGFLRGITAAGYATDKNWPASIIALTSDIERNYPQINRR